MSDDNRDGLWTGEWERDWGLAPSTVPSGASGSSKEGAKSSIDPERVYHPDEILSLNLSPQGFRAARDLGFAVSPSHPLKAVGATLARLRVPSGLTAPQALKALRERDPKGFYDLNALYRLAGAATSACQDVRCYPQSVIEWGTGCDTRARIGLIDSAINEQHPALARSAIRSMRLGPGGASAREAEHGTALAAILVGSRASAFPGLLPDAELIAADVFVDGGNGELYTDAARMAAGLDWVALQKPQVINLSVAGADSGVVHTVIRRISQSGIPIVAAVGNHGPDAAPAYPAAYEEVIAVTAVDSKLQIYGRANRGTHVALAAPGVDVWTPGEGTRGVLREGTSYAAPFVTAAVARLKAARPGADPAEIEDLLRKRARPLGPPGDNPVFGSGLLQAGCRTL